MNVSLDGRTAIVTGAGGGLGRAHALELARRGASVVVNDVGSSLSGVGGEDSPAAAVVGEITASGGTAVASYDSVATPEGGEAIVQTALDTFGSADVVVNNAGILRDRTMGKIDWADLDAVLAVHLKGAFHVTQPAYRAMRERGYGRIVFTSSNAGTFGSFGQTAYAAAKSALIGLSGTLAMEGARHGITSNVVCPIARTRMTEEMLGELARSLAPEQVAPLVAYLCSEQCELTHQVFSAGGGHFARVFTGLTTGWQAPTSEPATPEQIAEHMREISDDVDFMTPLAAATELEALSEVLKASATA